MYQNGSKSEAGVFSWGQEYEATIENLREGALIFEVFRGSMMIEQKIGSWREAPDDEMNLKHSEGYHKTVGSKY